MPHKNEGHMLSSGERSMKRLGMVELFLTYLKCTPVLSRTLKNEMNTITYFTSHQDRRTASNTRQAQDRSLILADQISSTWGNLWAKADHLLPIYCKRIQILFFNNVLPFSSQLKQTRFSWLSPKAFIYFKKCPQNISVYSNS